MFLINKSQTNYICFFIILLSCFVGCSDKDKAESKTSKSISKGIAIQSDKKEFPKSELNPFLCI